MRSSGFPDTKHRLGESCGGTLLFHHHHFRPHPDNHSMNAKRCRRHILVFWRNFWERASNHHIYRPIIIFLFCSSNLPSELLRRQGHMADHVHCVSPPALCDTKDSEYSLHLIDVLKWRICHFQIHDGVGGPPNHSVHSQSTLKEHSYWSDGHKWSNMAKMAIYGNRVTCDK